jgi:hypothetical protein
MIDPATGWFEMKNIPTKQADIISNVIEQTWLTKYPWPTQIIVDRGKEFMKEFISMIKNDYNIKRKVVTTRNPQSNSILERVHQTVGNILHTFQMHDSVLDKDNPWDGILAAIMFAIKATVHTVTRMSPMQLAFGIDAILNIQHEVNWKLIKQRKELRIKYNNRQENKKRKVHTYEVGDLITISNHSGSKYGHQANTGPFKVMAVNNNGTLSVKMNKVIDTINIRRVRPYLESK